jgi:hypothetical protein
MIKVLETYGRKFPQHSKATYGKPKDIILKGETPNPFPLKSGLRQGFPLSPLLLNIVLAFLAKAMKHDKEIKGIHIEVELSLFADT